jgi:hypothetical protein
VVARLDSYLGAAIAEFLQHSGSARAR